MLDEFDSQKKSIIIVVRFENYEATVT